MVEAQEVQQAMKRQDPQFGALVMALGGLIALTDRRYRTGRVAASEAVVPGAARAN